MVLEQICHFTLHERPKDFPGNLICSMLRHSCGVRPRGWMRNSRTSPHRIVPKMLEINPDKVLE